MIIGLQNRILVFVRVSIYDSFYCINMDSSDNVDDLFVCFVASRPKSTAMVMGGRSVHLTTLFSWAVNQYFVQILSLVTDNNPS